MALLGSRTRRDDTDGDEPPTEESSGSAGEELRVPLSRASLIVIGVAVGVGVVARFANDTPLWLDEALSVNIARLPVGEIVEALRHDGHPPLYYYLLHYWMALFGESDFATRALSGVISVATIPLAWLAGRRFGGRNVAWLTVLVFAVNAFAIRYADETRMYSLLMLEVFAGYLLVANSLEKPTWPRLGGISVVSGALLLTHYWAMYLVAAVGIMLVVRAVRVRQRDDRVATWKTLGALAAGGVLFLWWVPTLLYQSAHTGTPWADPERPATVLIITLQSFAGGARSETQVLALVMVLLVAAALFARTRSNRRLDLDLWTRHEPRDVAVALMSTIVIGSAVAYATQSTFQGRYAAVYFPLFALLVALGLDRFVPPRTRAVVLSAFLVLSLVAVGFEVTTTRSQSGEVAGAIVESSPPPEGVIVFCPDQLGPSVERVLPAGYEMVTYPDFEDPLFVDWVDYAERNAASDPNAFASELVERVDPDTPIFLVFNENYQTLEEKCPAVVNALGATRTPELLVRSDPDEFFEGMSLMKFTS